MPVWLIVMSEVVDVRYGGVPIAIVVLFVVPCPQSKGVQLRLWL